MSSFQQKEDSSESPYPELSANASAASGAAQSRTLLNTIESQVIPRLLLARRADCPSEIDESSVNRRPTAQQVVEFARIVLAGDTAQERAFIAELRDVGMTADAICLDLLGAVARHFGVLWEGDQADFVQVTVGVQRLQKIAHEMRAEAQATGAALRAGHRVLLVTLPGEQHVFGSIMVAELMRHAGWDVWDVPGGSDSDILSLVQNEWFAIVGVSISSADQLEKLAGFLRNLRRVSLNRAVGVMVGGIPFSAHPERVALVGADTTAIDGRDAVMQAERLIQLLGQRN
ncbi:MAG: cobalamin B12-binding domain-containing protein [Steroidobacteraceae bacterium]|jgi:hypothetical protein|nr:cobalamin B12-binding domain-containing protein [Gammaproteobacteria bacterium]